MLPNNHSQFGRGRTLPQAPFTAERPAPQQRRSLASETSPVWGGALFPATEQRPTAKSRLPTPSQTHSQLAPAPVAVVANPSNDSPTEASLPGRPSYAWHPAPDSSSTSVPHLSGSAVGGDITGSNAELGPTELTSSVGPHAAGLRAGAPFLTPAVRRSAPSAFSASPRGSLDGARADENIQGAEEETSAGHMPSGYEAPSHSHLGPSSHPSAAGSSPSSLSSSHASPFGRAPSPAAIPAAATPTPIVHHVPAPSVGESPLSGALGSSALDLAALSALSQMQQRQRDRERVRARAHGYGPAAQHSRPAERVQSTQGRELYLPRPLPVPSSLVWPAGSSRLGPLTEAVLLGFARAPPPRLPAPLPDAQPRVLALQLKKRAAPQVPKASAASAAASASSSSTTTVSVGLPSAAPAPGPPQVIPVLVPADSAPAPANEVAVGTLLLTLVLAVLIALLAVFVAANMIIASDGAGLKWGPLASTT